MPVKIEKGESPMKRSGKAITIDGAFSEAYGDHGYTLVLEPDRTFLATHHHFESVEAAVREGKDIIPTITVVRAVGAAAPRGRHRARARRSAPRSACWSAWSPRTGPMPCARGYMATFVPLDKGPWNCLESGHFDDLGGPNPVGGFRRTVWCPCSWWSWSWS